MLLFSLLGKHLGWAQGGTGTSSPSPPPGQGTRDGQAPQKPSREHRLPRRGIPGMPPQQRHSPRATGISPVRQPRAAGGQAGGTGGGHHPGQPHGLCPGLQAAGWSIQQEQDLVAPRRRPALAAPRVLGQGRSRTRLGASRSSPNTPRTPKPHSSHVSHGPYIPPALQAPPANPRTQGTPVHPRIPCTPRTPSIPCTRGIPCIPRSAWSPCTPCTPQAPQYPKYLLYPSQPGNPTPTQPCHAGWVLAVIPRGGQD